MNLLRRATKLLPRYGVASVAVRRLTLEALSGRSLLRLRGAEVVDFMQGLVTNDMKHLVQGSPSMYAMFLNKAGKVMYDTIVYRASETDTFLVECDRSVSTDLKKHLQMFKVRRKIDITSVDDELHIWVAYKPYADVCKNDASDKLDVDENAQLLICRDPRTRFLGTRIIAPATFVFSDLRPLIKSETCEEASADTTHYTLHRYQVGVGEGVNELPPGKCFPLEANCDFLHGVSFHKGCYLGQEFTARTYHTGVIRKRLMPIHLSATLDNLSETEVKNTAGQLIGKLRGIDKDHGLALLRVEQALQSKSLLIGNIKGTTTRPQWWPNEAPERKSLK